LEGLLSCAAQGLELAKQQRISAGGVLCQIAATAEPQGVKREQALGLLACASQLGDLSVREASNPLG
tara:strand:- start:125 stop:325 length:201 start_codon:yes stop_codon:yes gene_type:complete